MIDVIIVISLTILFIAIPFIGFYIENNRIYETMSDKEYQKIKELFKEYGITQTGNGILLVDGNRYTELVGNIKGIRIKVFKKKFRFIVKLEPDLSMQQELGISAVNIYSIRYFNKLCKNGIIEYFEERIKMKKLENKLNRIEEDF